jgi:hypothetical protein
LNEKSHCFGRLKCDPEPESFMNHFPRESAGMTRQFGQSGARRANEGAWCAVALVVITMLTGAGGPEIIRARVPANEVSKWFPAGTDLRVMAAREFESLVARANEGLVRGRASDPPRLIRASHHGRFSSGVLSGRSELVIEAAKSGPADFILEPWAPAILATPQTSKVVGARDSGEPSLWIDQPPNQTIVLDWELQPQSHVNGRSFALGLPGNETTVLTLDVPKDWMPSSRRGRRRGPLKSTAGSDQNRWEIESESGRIDVHLYQPTQGAALVESNTWVSGSSQIDLRSTADRAGSLVNWKTQWHVDLDPRNPKLLRIELDPGVELIDVQGAAVRAYHSERSGNATRLAVTVDSGLETSTELRILAHTQVPAEGEWKIPGLRPLDAIWTGGTTTVFLDKFHVMKECREKAGRLVFPSSPDSGQVERLEFESGSPRSVAELVFHRPRADTSCAVRGRLFVAGSPARLECELSWAIHDGSMPELAIDLSPAWLPEKVVIRGMDDPVAWHPTLLSSGSTRIHVALPVTTISSKELVVIVGANSTISGERGPLQLPRVRPVGARMSDEAWVACVDPGTMIQPTVARGLAWIDPSEVPGLVAPRPGGPDLREALAWRWIAEEAEARVDRERIEQEPGASIRLHARIDPTGRRLIIDGRILVYAGAGPLGAVPLWISQSEGLLEPWRYTDEAGAQVATKPIDGSDRSRLGFPREGSARGLDVKIPYQTEKTIYFHAEYSWNNHGVLPLVLLPREYQPRGVVVVEALGMLQTRLKAVGLRRLAASALEPAGHQPGEVIAGRDRDEKAPRKNAQVDAFAYNEPGGRLELFSEPLMASEPPGFVREALLTTSVDPKGTLLNRLRMVVNHGEARSLDLVMPSGLTLVRVRRDGVEVTPIQSPAGLSIPLTESGSRSSAIVVDYLAAGGMVRDGARLWPDLPRVALPCLSFIWEVVTSSAWRAADSGPGLISTDREELLDWPYAALGLPTPSWNFARAGGRRPGAEALRLVDDRLADSVSAELTFAEWFSRWDAGPWPVVVDRVSLSSAGLGPKSQCVPTSSKAEPRNVVMATLKQYGLTLAPFPNVFVITALAELPKLESRGRWGELCAEALVWGSDRTDRFQTLARWRGEPSPKLVSAIGEEAAVGIKLPPGWSAWRFEGRDWPKDDAFVYLLETRTRMITGWILAGICLLAWLWFGRRLARRRFIVLAVVMALSLLGGWLVPSRYASYIAAVYLATLGLLVIELGRVFWRPLASDRVPRRSESSLVRRVASSAVSVALAILLLDRMTVVRAAGPDSAILALFPYEGQFDPTRPPLDVIIRLVDFTRLTHLAESEAAPPGSWVRAVGAVHRVARKSASDVGVESEIELLASGRAPFAWEFPVSSARDIQVALDGKRLPVSIKPGGASGVVAIPQAGKHLLRIHRSVATRMEQGLECLRLPVNAMPSARVVVAPREDGRQDGELIARGGSALQPDNTLIGRLGPADRVEVRWGKPASTDIDLASGNVEGLLLWDVTPAGDRIRARFTTHQPRKRSTIRFAHQEGLLLRSARVPGSAGTFCQEDGAKGEWTLHVDPPLEAGSTIELDCWLPLESVGSDGSVKSPSNAGLAGGLSRVLPRLQPTGVERYSGSLGVRRPGEWTGRFDPLPDTDPTSDESFVESWGALPQEPLTLCGTSRFVRECRASLQTGPAPTRVQVNPTINVQIESGRIAMTVDAELAELSGHLRDVEIELPENIQIIEVTAEGLTDWTVAVNHKLHLIFDRPITGTKRNLRVLGFIPLLDEPLQFNARKHRIKTPWFLWDGMEASAGFLTISSTVKPELLESTGLTLLSSESSGAVVTTSPSHRSTYRVDDPRKMGEIRWESMPARVSVAIESQMTIHPDSVEWVAVLRYDVIGGALDAIHLKMPAVWAAGVALHLSDSEFQLTKETRGPDAFWTITPARPIWGSQRFVLKASRPVESEAAIVHPEIAPRGEGFVDAYLNIVNATGRQVTIENFVGLDKIAPGSKFQAREFATSAGTAFGVFRVMQKSWILRVQSPRNVSPDSDFRDGSARVASADITLEAMPDRSIIGRAVYDTVPGTGPSLSFELPPESSLLWATVDFEPGAPLRSSTGTWSIACDQHRQSRIGLLWRTGPPAPGPTLPVPLPRAGVGPAMTFVSVYSPPGAILRQGIIPGLELVGMARWEMARADWLARSIGDLVAKFDRSSGREHEKLVSLLINHEMALRGAQRNVRWTARAGTKEESGRVEHDLNLIRAARAAREETMRRAGLDDDLSSARIYLGEIPAKLTRPMRGVPEPSEPDRIRLFGRPSPLIGIMPGIDAKESKVSLTLEERPWDVNGNGSHYPSIITIILLVGLLLVTVLIGRWSWQGFLALVTALGLAGYTGGPLILAGAVGLAVAGWRMGRGSANAL